MSEALLERGRQRQAERATALTQAWMGRHGEAVPWAAGLSP